MHVLSNPTWRLIGPVLWRVDWRHRYWAASDKMALKWLFFAFLANLLAQSTVGKTGWLAVLLSAVSLFVIHFLPRRLVAAIGALMVTQALVSIALALVLAAAGLPPLTREIILVSWALWCMASGLRMALTYLRTPKAEMPG